MGEAGDGEQVIYTGAQRASGKGEQWPHQGEKAELCSLRALGGDPRVGGHQALPCPPAGPWLRPPGLGGLRFPRYTGDTNGQTPPAWQAQSLKEAEGEREGGRSDGPRQAGPHTRCPQALSPCLALKALKSVSAQSKSLPPEGLNQS